MTSIITSLSLLVLSFGSSFSAINEERVLSCDIQLIDETKPSGAEQFDSDYNRAWFYFEFPGQTLTISAKTIELADGSPLVDDLPPPKNTSDWLAGLLENDREFLRNYMFMLTDVFDEGAISIEGLQGYFYAANVAMEYDRSEKEVTALWAATEQHKIHTIRFFVRPTVSNDIANKQQVRSIIEQGLRQCGVAL